MPVGIITRTRMPHTRRLSLAKELSGYAGTFQKPVALSLRCVAADRALHVAVYQLYGMHHWLFLLLLRALYCIILCTLCSWLPPLGVTSVSTPVCHGVEMIRCYRAFSTFGVRRIPDTRYSDPLHYFLDTIMSPSSSFRSMVSSGVLE